MNPETVKAIQDALTPIAEKIGQGASFGWEVVVRQQFIVGIQDLLELVISIPLLIGALFLMRKAWNDQEGGLAVFFGIIAVLCLLWTLFGLESGIGHLINPNFYAIQFFIDLAKPKS